MVRITALLCALLYSLCAGATITVTATIIDDDTTGVVNFLDPLTYTKPRYYDVAVPNEASSPNKYYALLSGGSGTTCSQAVPCAFTSVCGKSTAGGAYVYLKGNGRISISGCALAGTASVPVVVKPWPSDATPMVSTAVSGCTVGSASTIAGGSGFHHVIFDGGPDMLFRFVGSGCTSDQNGYTLTIRSNDITLWRVRVDANDSSGPALGPATGSGTSMSNFRFINSELYNANRYYGVYTGGGTGCGAGDTSHTNIEFRNSIFRQIDGRGIQIEPRSNSSGVIIDGNAFHDIGYNNSGNMGPGGISAAVQPADSCAGITSNVLVTNNIGWDLAGGLVHFAGNSPNSKVYHNTVWDYAKAGLINPASRGISCASSCAESGRGIFNNLLMTKPGSVQPFHPNNNGWSSDNNMCETTSDCGQSALAGTSAATVYVSTSPNASNFLFPKGPALGAGSLITGVETDYLGNTRTGAVDIGAIEQ